jgi:hypothetical protein
MPVNLYNFLKKHHNRCTLLYTINRLAPTPTIASPTFSVRELIKHSAILVILVTSCDDKHSLRPLPSSRNTSVCLFEAPSFLHNLYFWGCSVVDPVFRLFFLSSLCRI